MNPPAKFDQLPVTRTYDDDELQAAIDRLLGRVQTLRNSMKDKTPMKYALESLPELIGEDQFRDLCIALGIDTCVQLPTGSDLASVIRSKVLKRHDQMAEERRQMQSERFL